MFVPIHERSEHQMMRIRYTVSVTLYFAFSLIVASTLYSDARGLPRECALIDLAAVAWVEEQAEKREMAPALLAEAAFAVLRARNVCASGKVAEALDLYEGAMSGSAGTFPSGSVNRITQSPAATP
jgi:hypothetical protein